MKQLSASELRRLAISSMRREKMARKMAIDSISNPLPKPKKQLKHIQDKDSENIYLPYQKENEGYL